MIELTLPGMTCGGCARGVTAAVTTPKRRTNSSDTCTLAPPSGRPQRGAGAGASTAARRGPMPSLTASAPAAHSAPKPKVVTQRFMWDSGAAGRECMGRTSWRRHTFAGLVPRVNPCVFRECGGWWERVGVRRAATPPGRCDPRDV